MNKKQIQSKQCLENRSLYLVITFHIFNQTCNENTGSFFFISIDTFHCAFKSIFKIVFYIMWHINFTLWKELSASLNETILISRVLLSVKIYLNIGIQFYITWHLWGSYFTAAGFWIDKITTNIHDYMTCYIEKYGEGMI